MVLFQGQSLEDPERLCTAHMGFSVMQSSNETEK